MADLDGVDGHGRKLRSGWRARKPRQESGGSSAFRASSRSGQEKSQALAQFALLARLSIVRPAIPAALTRASPPAGLHADTLLQQPLCPLSRYVRLILGEYGIPARLAEERFWERREEFLLLNPAGEIPVLVADGQPPVPGAAIIAEYLDETRPPSASEDRLLPPTPPSGWRCGGWRTGSTTSSMPRSAARW